MKIINAQHDNDGKQESTKGSFHMKSNQSKKIPGSYSHNWFILILQVPMYEIYRHAIFFHPTLNRS